MPEILFAGPAGRLEGRYQAGSHPDAPIALILHPHPQHGGTMNSKVTYALFRTFSAMGFHTLRFNFRGVGRSEGVFENGEGELSDAAAAMDWLQSIHKNPSEVWIGGFSFGAWIAMQLLMRRPEMNGFIAVSPPADRYDFGFLAPCPVSGLVIQGTDDTVVANTSVNKMVSKMSLQSGVHVRYQEVKGAGHFYENHMPELCATVTSYVKRNINDRLIQLSA